MHVHSRKCWDSNAQFSHAHTCLGAYRTSPAPMLLLEDLHSQEATTTRYRGGTLRLVFFVQDLLPRQKLRTIAHCIALEQGYTMSYRAQFLTGRKLVFDVAHTVVVTLGRRGVISDLGMSCAPGSHAQNLLKHGRVPR